MKIEKQQITNQLSLDDVLNMFISLRRGKSSGQDAPHKPLLILYAMGQLLQEREFLLYKNVDDDLTKLLKEFGPQKKPYHTEYPFCRLKNDGFWEVTSKSGEEIDINATKSKLISEDATGSFTDDVKIILNHSNYASIVAHMLLAANFPNTLHQNILDSVGLSLDPKQSNRKRDPDFRRKVLRAYGRQCCVCKYDIRLGDKSVGIEAAHIMWWQDGGPDIESNGLALCVLHHKLYDLGAFTIDVDGETIICSEELSDGERSDWILDFHKKKLKKPQSERYYPNKEFIRWHRETIFKEPKRD